MPITHPEPRASTVAEITTGPESAAALVARAEKLVQQGDFDAAIRTLDTAIALAPDEADAWRAKAGIMLKVGRTDDALDVLDAALERVGAERSLLLDKARLHGAQSDFARSREAYDRLTTIEPESADGWLGKGRTLLREENAQAALDCAERWLAVDERSTNGHILRGDSLLALGRCAEALAAFVLAAKYGPDRFDASSWASRGDRLLQYGQPELALEAYERAISQDETNPEGWHGKGVVLKGNSDFEGAVAAFDTASSVDHRFIAGFLNAGELCLNRGLRDRALDFFNRATANQPDDSRCWIAVGSVYGELNRHEEARLAFEHAAEISPRDAGTWNALGNSLFNLGRLDEALHSYETAIEIAPDYSWAHHNLAWAFFKCCRLDRAFAEMDRAIQLEPNSKEFQISNLMLLNYTDRVEEAEVDARADRALETAGSHPTLTLVVAGFLADNDRLDRARELLNGLETSGLDSPGTRMDLAECWLKVGENTQAVQVLRGICPSQLSGSHRVAWPFLCMLADRLAGAPQISESLLVRLLSELGEQSDQVHWSYKGVRRLLARCELPVLDKLALATLIQIQEAGHSPSTLSLYTEISKAIERNLRATGPDHTVAPITED